MKGRAISFYLTILFGSFALGGAIWGRVTTHWSIHTSLLVGEFDACHACAGDLGFPLTVNEGKDLTPARTGPPGEDVLGPRVGSGPVELTIRYSLPEHRAAGFTDLLHDLRRTRLRNGANIWHLERSSPAAAQCELKERVVFGSWQEYTGTIAARPNGTRCLSAWHGSIT